MVVQGGAQDRVEPRIHPVDIAELILARQHPDAELLQHILGIGAVAKPFDQEPHERAAPVQQRAFRRSAGHLPLATVLRCHDVPALSAHLALSCNDGLTVAFCSFNAGGR